MTTQMMAQDAEQGKQGTTQPAVMVAHNGDMLIVTSDWNVRIEFDERAVAYQEVGDGGAPDCPHCGASWLMGKLEDEVPRYRLVDREDYSVETFVGIDGYKQSLNCGTCGEAVATWSLYGWKNSTTPKERNLPDCERCGRAFTVGHVADQHDDSISICQPCIDRAEAALERAQGQHDDERGI